MPAFESSQAGLCWLYWLYWWHLDFLLFVILGLKASDKIFLKESWLFEKCACSAAFFSFHGRSCANAEEATSSLFWFKLSGKYPHPRPVCMCATPFQSIHLQAVIGTRPSNSLKSTGTISKFWFIWILQYGSETCINQMLRRLLMFLLARWHHLHAAILQCSWKTWPGQNASLATF